MRVGYSTTYSRLSAEQMNVQSNFVDISTQLASGKVIQYSYEDSSTYIDTLRLDYELTNLEQVKDVSQRAQTYSNNTDVALGQMTSTLDQVRVKLVQAANEVNSPESLDAIADELEALKDHLISLGNTTIGSEYIFSGSAVGTKPIDSNGEYQGNSEELQGLIGSNNLLTYNITGEEIFLGENDATNRLVTTNVQLYNQEKLNPATMSELESDAEPVEEYISEDDTLRALIGDDNNDTTDDSAEWFYITGVKSDGTAFKSKFSLEKAYSNEDEATKVSDLLERIGIEFGNTALNEVVSVSLNSVGQIEIVDQRSGRSNIEFHMVSSDTEVDDINDLVATGAKVTEYIKSDFYNDKVSSKATSVNDNYDHRISTFNSTFQDESNNLADANSSLEEVFGENVSDIVLSGNKVNGGGAVNTTFNIAGKTMEDLVDAIKIEYSAEGSPYSDIDVNIIDGKITIIDNTVVNADSGLKEEPYSGASTLSVVMDTQDGAGNAVNGFANSSGIEYDSASFSKSGSVLSSNVSQIVTDTNDYATSVTKLVDVAGSSLDGVSYDIDFTDINGHQFKGTIDFSDAGTTFTITDNDSNPLAITADWSGSETYTLYDPEIPGSATSADEVTYQQLSDVTSIMMNFSNLYNASMFPDSDENYANALTSSYDYVDVSLDYKGRLEIQDNTTAYTQANFSIAQSDSSDFTISAGSTDPDAQGPYLTFQANNALVVNDPHMDFFDTLDVAIQAVRDGLYRADGDNENDPRSIGIQNALSVVEDLAANLNKVHAKNGAQGNSFTYSIEKNELLIVQVQSLNSTVIDVDLAEASLQFQQLSINYQAMLSTVSKINSMSLVNYI